MLKKFLCILLVLILAYSAGQAKASENKIPYLVSAFFDTSKWVGYKCVSSLVHNENPGGIGTIALIMRKDTIDVLCIFHIKGGKWELVVKNDSILPRTGLLPMLENYGDPNWVTVKYNHGAYWESLSFYRRGNTLPDKPLVWSFSGYAIYTKPFDLSFDRFAVSANDHIDGLFYLYQSLSGEDAYKHLPLYSTWDIDLRNISYDDIPKTYTQVLAQMSQTPPRK